MTKAPQLPATTLTQDCYRSMFRGCTSLTEAPVLPATTLSNSCYRSMFNECTSLTKAPVLPATTLAESCYQDMFQDCTSLTKTPELPATSLASYCYYYMFSGCTSLTEASKLPATSLASTCYAQMFRLCSSLTSFNFGDQMVFADLANNFERMFSGSSKLSYIRILFDDRDGAGPRDYPNWTSGVAPQGTFVTNTNKWKRGVNGIPSDWEVVIEGTTV